MDTIIRILPGESYNGIRGLADLPVCVNKCQLVFWRRCRENGCCDFVEPGFSLYLLFYLSLSMDSIMPINQFAAPTGAQLVPLESLKPILTSGYELRPSLINLVQEQSFLGEGDENPYTHL